jgi:hypothetical protein
MVSLPGVTNLTRSEENNKATSTTQQPAPIAGFDLLLIFF